MRILLISDIHANWAALQALNEPHDVCVCLGDLVDYGMEPAPCIEWVRQKAHHVVRGNHDHAVAQNIVVTGAKRGFRYLSAVTRPISRQRVGPEDVRYLSRIPVTKTVTLDDKRYLFVHATPRDPLDEYGPPDPGFWSRRLKGVEADVVCVGHTHHPFVVEVGKQMVINPGSVGQPRDGDPRGAYAIIENGRVELKRYQYPVEDTVRTILDSSLPDDAKQLLVSVYRGSK